MATTKAWKKETLTRDTILRMVMAPFTLFSANSSPYFLHRLAKMFFGDRATKIVRGRTKKLRELESRNIVYFKKIGDALRIGLTPIGQILARKMEKEVAIEHVKPLPITINEKIWDKKWRLLIYDLTGLSKSTKDSFRKKIKSWGFYQMKRTVWVSPYDFKKELDQLCKLLKIDQDKIVYTTTIKIAKENQLKKFFNLKK